MLRLSILFFFGWLLLSSPAARAECLLIYYTDVSPASCSNGELMGTQCTKTIACNGESSSPNCPAGIVCRHPSEFATSFSCSCPFTDYPLCRFDPQFATAEVCGNNKDDNCDGSIDEGCACSSGTTRFCQRGLCGAGQQTCQSGGTWGACVLEVGSPASSESCNGVDDNCDGRIDEGCACTAGQKQPCGGGGCSKNSQGVWSCQGSCQMGTQTCVSNGAGGAYWGVCEGAVSPKADVQNGADDDCDGKIDEGVCAAGIACYPGGMGCSRGASSFTCVGECKTGVTSCPQGASGQATCTGATTPTAETIDHK